ncbi:MAG: DUF262 domain-containing protein [Clostridia bacterium]|nr:DUF262 domain-containing protein [Clostridia bacterium]
MNVKLGMQSQTIKINELLLSNHCYVIPRYQREFSWDKSNIIKLIDDLEKNTKLKNGKIKPVPYFIGITILEGEFNDETYELNVIDGQQRLTTITMILCCLRNIFDELQDETYKKKCVSLIFNTHKGHKNKKIFDTQNKTHYFPFNIQANEPRDNPESSEENCLFEGYNAIKSKLSSETIKNDFRKIHRIETTSYLDLLHAFYDQLINSYVILAWNTSAIDSNSFFNSMNSKSVPLSPVDNIKSSVFNLIDDVDPVDIAQDYWDKIHKNLAYNGEYCDFGNFLRQYWSSHYIRTSYNALYKRYLKTITTKEQAKKFLEDVNTFSEAYSCIVWNTKIGSKNAEKQIKEHLHYIIDDFKLALPRGFLATCYSLYAKNIIGSSILAKITDFLEMYHFIYGSVLSKRTNKLDPKYSEYSIKLNKATTKEEANKYLTEFAKSLMSLINENDETIKNSFLKLNTLKKNSDSYLACRYFVYKMENILSGNKINVSGGSVEHVFNKSVDEENHYIWNLCCLEENKNSEISEFATPVEKLSKYKESTYSYIKQIVPLIDTNITAEEQKEKLKQNQSNNLVIFMNRLRGLYD